MAIINNPYNGEPIVVTANQLQQWEAIKQMDIPEDKYDQVMKIVEDMFTRRSNSNINKVNKTPPTSITTWGVANPVLPTSTTQSPIKGTSQANGVYKTSAFESNPGVGSDPSDIRWRNNARADRGLYSF